MKLFRVELYKMLSRKSIWVFIGIIMLLLLIVFHSGNGQVKLQRIIQEDFYSDIEGPLTSEKMELIENRAEDMSHSSVSNIIKEEATRIKLIKDYYDSLGQRIDDLGNRIQEMESKNEHGFEYQSLVKQKGMLERIKAPQVYMDRGWILALGTINRDFFVVILILFGVCTVFSTEYSHGTDSLILTSVRGKKRLVLAKFSSSLTFIILVFIIMTAFVMVNLPSTYVLRGWDNPLQSVTTLSWSSNGTYMDSPYPITIKQYIIVSTLIRLIGCISVGLLALFVSSLSRSSFAAFLITLGIVFVPSGFGLLNSEWLTSMSGFSFSALLFPGDLFRTYKAYNIFGYPVLHLDLVLVIYSVVSLILAYLTYISFKRHQVY